MVGQSRTIDNLGPELERDYTRRIESLPEGENFLRPATQISQATEIPVISPAVAAEIDLLFGNTEQHPSWATFIAPPHAIPPNALFSYEIIPYLRFDIDALKEQQKHRKKGTAADEALAAKEEIAIANLHTSLEELNRWISIVNNNRLELTKG